MNIIGEKTQIGRAKADVKVGTYLVMEIVHITGNSLRKDNAILKQGLKIILNSIRFL